MLVKKKIQGYKMWLNPDDRGISHRLIARGGREPCFMECIYKEAFGIAYDVGANLGYTMLPMADRCGFVYAFEPDPRSLMLLKKNVKLNKLENVHVMQLAMVEHPIKTVNMFLDAKPNLTRVMQLDAPPKGSGCFVEGVSIDSFQVGNNHYPNFIKMDIEGGEVNALKGAMKTLEKAEHLKILIEVHPDQYSKYNDFAEVLREIFKIGYQLKYVINAKGKIDLLKPYTLVKKFKKFPRAIWTDVPVEKAIPWICEMPDDGLKVVRAIMLERKI